MSFVKNYILPRIVTYLAVIFVGLTLCFIIVRIGPSDPVLVVLNRYAALGQIYDPETFEALRNTLMELYGLKGSLWDQYLAFFRRVITGDFGPSLSAYPIPVTEIIYNALPWTIGLLLITTLTSWIIGNIIGGVAGYYSDRKWVKVLTGFALVIHPIPYYVMGLLFILLFIYIFPIFPITGGVSVGIKPSFSLEYIIDVVYHAFLPGLSLVVAGYGWWFISMRSLVANVKSEDYVSFGKIVGLSERTILTRYIIRNSLLPQVTGLSMSLGSIFSGAMATEVIFGYPGIGTLLYRAVLEGDFNLMFGIVSYSIIAVATAILVLDLLYPLVDPRIRHK